MHILTMSQSTMQLLVKILLQFFQIFQINPSQKVFMIQFNSIQCYHTLIGTFAQKFDPVKNLWLNM